MTVFCPTYLVTGKLFRQISSIQGVNWIQGHLGISKTFSCILYTLLSKYVIAYKMEDQTKI